MAKKQTEPLFPHLRYATLSDVRKSVLPIFGVWVFLSVVYDVFVLLAQVGTSFVPENIKWQSPLPFWANYTIIVTVVLWFARGKTLHVHYRLPLLSFGGWLGVSLWVSSFANVWEIMPPLLAAPAMLALGLLVILLDDLNAQGRKNLDAIKGSEELGEPV